MRVEINTIWSVLERLATLIGILMLAFAAGQNWHRVDVISDEMLKTSSRVERFQEEISRDYVRKDVVKEQLDGLNSKLNDVIGRLNAIQQRQRGGQ